MSNETEKARRTAIVFVHGQGDQTPMNDVRELIYSAWETDNQINNGDEENYWSIQNADAALTDTRRLVTPENEDGRRFDFLEFYWADLMEGNKFRHVWTWFTRLLNKGYDETPKHLQPLRRLVYAICIAIGYWVVGFLLMAAAIIMTQDTTYPKFVTSLDLILSLQGPFHHIFYLLGQIVGAVVSLYVGYMLLSWILSTRSFWRRANTTDFYKHDQKVKEETGSFSLLAGWVVLLFLAMTVYPSINPSDITVLMLLAVIFILRSIQSNSPGKIISASVFIMLFSIPISLFFIKNEATNFYGVQSVNTTIAFSAWGLMLATWAKISWEIGIFTKKRLKHLSLGILGFLISTGLFSFLGTEGLSWSGITALKMFMLSGLILGAGSVVAVVLLFLAGNSFLLPVMGDTARYLSKKPENIAARNNIQQRGVKLLEEISKSNKYDRIIILAHSLGSVVAYDVLNSFWGKYHTKFANELAEPELIALEKATQQFNEDEKYKTVFLDAQKNYYRALKSLDLEIPWKIEHFITVGSPLAYGHFLLSPFQSGKYLYGGSTSNWDSRKNFENLKEQRELPTSPPQVNKYEQFSYPADQTCSVIHTPHHGAVFSAVKWTNMYFGIALPETNLIEENHKKPSESNSLTYDPMDHFIDGNLIAGDIVAPGPASVFFGKGIIDVHLDRPKGWENEFLHNHYWKMEKGFEIQNKKKKACLNTPAHIKKLREILDL